MDVVHCVITVPNEVAKFNRAADKTPLQRLSYMSCRTPLTIADFGMFDVAKLHFFSKLDKKKFAFAQNIGKGNQDIFTLRLVEYKEFAQGNSLLNGTIIASLLFYFIFFCQTLQQGFYTWYILGYYIPHGLWNNVVIVMH